MELRSVHPGQSCDLEQCSPTFLIGFFLKRCRACSATCSTGYTLTNGACVASCKDGSVLVNGACKRITGCSTNADCVSQTGSSTSYCYLSSDGNACFSGSSNSAGLPTGSACGWSSNLSGDDNSCYTGLVCLNHVCSAATTNDPSNCGKAGNVCPTPANGSRTCQAGYAAIISKSHLEYLG